MRYRPLSAFGEPFYQIAFTLANNPVHEIKCRTVAHMEETRELLYHFRYALRRAAPNGLEEHQTRALNTLNQCKFLMEKETCTLTIYKKQPLELPQ